MDGNAFGWLLLVVGLVVTAIGLLWLLVPAVPLGRLPGDLVIERERTRIYVPITTSILLSLLVTLILWLVRTFAR